MSTVQQSGALPTSRLGLTSQNPSDKLSFAIHKLRMEAARQYEAWRELPEEEKLRHIKLEQHGLSEQDLDNLPADERSGFEQKLAEASNQTPLGPNAAEQETGKAIFKQVISLASVLAISEGQQLEGTNPQILAGVAAALEPRNTENHSNLAPKE